MDDGIGEGNVDLGRRFLGGGHHGRERQGMLHVKELSLSDCEAGEGLNFNPCVEDADVIGGWVGHSASNR